MWTKGKMKVIDDEGDCIFLEVDTPEANVTIAEIYTLGDNIDRAKGIANARRICKCVNEHSVLVHSIQIMLQRWEKSGPSGSAQWEKFDAAVLGLREALALAQTQD